MCSTMGGIGTEMHLVKIRISNHGDEAKGFLALAKQGKVVCFADHTYEIAKSHLKILDDLDIAYEVISEEGFDRVCHALRNPTASQV